MVAIDVWSEVIQIIKYQVNANNLSCRQEGIFNHDIQYHQLISAHFGENRVILLQMVAK